MRHAFLFALLGCGHSTGPEAPNTPAPTGAETVLSAPTSVLAEDGTSPDYVRVAWAASPGATSYGVYRDGTFIAQVDTTSFLDTGAGPPPVPATPTGLLASDGGFADAVHLSWSAPPVTPGPVHAYTVTARVTGAESVPSASDVGFRGPAPVTSYAITSDGGGSWQDLGLITDWMDLNAPAGTVDLGSGLLAASKGNTLDHVDVSVGPGATAAGAAVTYAVRAASAAGNSAPSATDIGFRGAATLRYAWTMWRDDNDSSPAEVAVTASPQYIDTSARTLPRWYRCRITAGASQLISNRDFGMLGRADTRHDEWWAPNGTVYAIAATGGALYVGGTFDYVGPHTGSFVSVGPSGAVTSTWLDVDASVTAIVSDGLGGSYIGGSFLHVQGQPRRGIAHILPNGDLDPSFHPDPAGGVNSMVADTTSLYVAFSGAPPPLASALVRVDRASGAMAEFPTGSLLSGVNVVAAHAGVLYVGGSFTTYTNAQHVAVPRTRLMAFDLSGATPTAFAPVIDDGEVMALAADETQLYVGGNFSTSGGQTRNGIAAFGLGDALLSSWDPQSLGGAVQSLVAASGVVYAGGQLGNIGGQLRTGLAALNNSTGEATSWDPALANVGHIRSLVLDHDILYVGGLFESAGGIPRHNVVALDTTTAIPTSWAPHTGGTVWAMSVVGAQVTLGGDFQSVGGSVRNAGAAFDLASGQLLSWDPRAETPGLSGGGIGINALAVGSMSVYVGGTFTTLGGASRSNIGEVDLVDGNVTGWDPAADATVSQLAVSPDGIYASGGFSVIGGQSRNGLALLNAASGTATAFDPNANAQCLAVNGSTLMVGGAFTSIGGQPRSHLAELQGPSGDATGFGPDPNGGVNALAVASGAVYFAGAFTSVAATGRTHLASVDISSSLVSDWRPVTAGILPVPMALAVAGDRVYVGGHFSSINGDARSGLAVVDATTGGSLGWNPEGNLCFSTGVLSLQGALLFRGGGYSPTPNACVSFTTNSFSVYGPIP